MLRMLIVGLARGSLFNKFCVFCKGVIVSIDHVVYVGGSANSGATAGVFFVTANNDASNANRNIGTQTAVATNHNTPARKGEYVIPLTLGRATEQRGCEQR